MMPPFVPTNLPEYLMEIYEGSTFRHELADDPVTDEIVGAYDEEFYRVLMVLGIDCEGGSRRV